MKEAHAALMSGTHMWLEGRLKPILGEFMMQLLLLAVTLSRSLRTKTCQDLLQEPRPLILIQCAFYWHCSGPCEIENKHLLQQSC